MITVYFDYKLHRYDSKGLAHWHHCSSLDEARAYVRRLRQRVIDAHVTLEYIEVRDAGRKVIWAWGEGAY